MFKILVFITKGTGGVNGGVTATSQVIEFDNKADAERATVRLEEYKNMYHTVVAIRLY